MNDRFPDFFIIGAPKCGTTSLFSWLQQHSDTYLPIKEPGFLSLDILDVRREPGGVQSDSEYLDRLCPHEYDGRLRGDSTPKYLYSDQALAALSPHVGRIKLIVMLRNPIDIAIAMHAQNIRQGRETEPNFGLAWARGPARANDRLTDYCFWAKPGHRLERWMSLFPREDIKILILEEDLRVDPQKAHIETLRFLGLKREPLASYQLENPRRYYRSPRLQSASRRLRRIVNHIVLRLGLTPRSSGILRVLDSLNKASIPKDKVSPELRVEISKVLIEDVRVLARVLKRDKLPWREFEPYL